jgi:hypothetical protein
MRKGEQQALSAIDYFHRGLKAFARDDWQGAAEAFLEAICREPDAPAGWLVRLACALMNLGDFRGAEILCRHAIAREANPPADWFVDLGRAHQELGEWQPAVDAFEQAIARQDDPPAAWFFQLGQVRARLRDWQAAADAFGKAVAAHRSAPPAWWQRLGTAHERLKQWEEAARAYGAALAADPAATDFDRRLLEKEPHEFPARRAVLRFLERKIDDIRERAAAQANPTPGERGPIFCLWIQGFDNAPPVVQACRRQLLKSASREVVCLDAGTLPKYAELPPDIASMEMSMAHRSDLVRLELLARYGGTWLDATCLVRSDFDERLEEVSASGFFAFAKRKATLSNWLLSVDRPGHYLILMMREALHAYWRRFGRMNRYYAFHYIFEGLVELDPGVREIWEATPKIPHRHACSLQTRMFVPYGEDRFRALIDRAFVQKLTYRYRPQRARAGTMLGHVLRTY